jgi:hypothetical protein
MQSRWLLIDGYSLLHRHPELQHRLKYGLDSARLRLLRELEPVVREFAPRTTVVFDGKSHRVEEHFESSLIEVLFSPSHLTADTVIERLVQQASQPEEILVVTSDRAERETVSAAGAEVMSCAQFLHQCENTSRAARHSAGRQARSTRKPRLGDFFPS